MIILCLAARRVNGESALWQKVSDGINENTVNCVRVHPQDSRRIFAGTPQALYVSRDQGKSFQSFFQSQSSQKAVNAVFVDLAAPTSIYLAGSGLFVSANDGEGGRDLWPGRSAAQMPCGHRQRRLWRGDGRGVFIKFDGGNGIRRAGTWDENRSILAQARYVYAATSTACTGLKSPVTKRKESSPPGLRNHDAGSGCGR